MQSCHNDVRAMTPRFYVSNEGATLGLSRAICKKFNVASLIVEIVRAKDKVIKTARNGKNGAWTVTHEGFRRTKNLVTLKEC